jgi:protein gp37
MAYRSKIEWTDATWNPIVAIRRDTDKVGFHCERVSPACTNCYAATFNGRMLPARGTGLDYVRSSRDQVEIGIDNETLQQPMKWRKPRKIFPCSMTDLFGEFVPFELVDRVFAVMYNVCPRHTFQVLTKRPERMAEYLLDPDRVPKIACLAAAEFQERSGGVDVLDNGAVVDDLAAMWPLPNVWIGATMENQEWFDRRIEHLLRCQAAVRFVSAEPLLGPIEFHHSCIDQMIVGGESGHHDRPANIDHIRQIVHECQDSGTAVFVKQLGRRVRMTFSEWNDLTEGGTTNCNFVLDAPGSDYGTLRMIDSKGGDPSEWPADLRVRQFPRTAIEPSRRNSSR